MKQPAGTITLSSEEGEVLIAQVQQSNWPAAVAGRVEQIIRLYFWVVFALQEAKLSVKRLRTLLFGSHPHPQERPASEVETTSSEVPGQAAGKKAAAPVPVEEGAPGLESTGREAGPEVLPGAGSPKATGGHRPGTGRLGADAYVGAKRIECPHEDLAVGQRCPVCGQGTLYELPPGVEIRIDGNALLSAVRYELEKWRCSACGEIFTAGLPAEVGEEQYSAQARAVLAVSRYYLGVPGYRLQGYQAMLGVPVPDATQWDEIEVVGDRAYKVFAQMEREAAQGELIFQDDTAVRLLSLMQENRAILSAAQAQGLSRPQERTGMHTTALAVQVGEHTAILYYSSRRHAGANLQELLEKRPASLAKPLAMSDALSSNEVAEESRLIRCHCLAHGRRKFKDLEATFPHECQVVLAVISQVFDHDEQAREDQLNAEARLAYHQRQSQPLMEALKRWLDTQIDDHLVEPNSSLGKAIGYMRTHWNTLTRFLSVKGAPLDNNLAERLLKLFIRQVNIRLTHFNKVGRLYCAIIAAHVIRSCALARRDVDATPSRKRSSPYACRLTRVKPRSLLSEMRSRHQSG